MKKILNGEMVEMTTEEIAEIKAFENSDEYKMQRIDDLKNQLKEMDYIGIKISTGRATVDEYADKIKLMNQYADEINRLESELNDDAK